MRWQCLLTLVPMVCVCALVSSAQEAPKLFPGDPCLSSAQSPSKAQDCARCNAEWDDWYVRYAVIRATVPAENPYSLSISAKSPARQSATDKQRATEMRAAQSVWERERDTSCRKEAKTRAGEVEAKLAEYRCHSRLDRERMKQLDQQFQGGL